MTMSWAILTAPAIVTTGFSALSAALHLAGKRTISRKAVLICLLVAVALWIPAVLAAVGAIPMPPLPPHNLN
ncbi:MAG TPA: hypothetical protein VG125_13870 [Pirellulales bacterium]|jgi:hypothetical protein|nr:hypothetical protein [Pirellulales bacterium]